MRRRIGSSRRHWLAAAWLLAVGASGTFGEQTAPPTPGQGPTTQPTVASQPDRATMRLEDIFPSLVLPEPRTPAPEDLPVQARDLLTEAAGLIRDQRAVMAIVKLETALKYAPNSRAVHLALGQAHVASDNPAKAELHLAKALTLGSDDRQGWYWLGRSQRSLGRNRDALRSLALGNLASRAEPTSPLAVLLPYELGRLLQVEGYTSAALGPLEKALLATAAEKLSPAQKADPEVFALASRDRGKLVADVARLKLAAGQGESAIRLLESLSAEERATRPAQVALLAAFHKEGKLDRAGETLANLARQTKPGEVELVVDEVVSAIGSTAPLAALAEAQLFGTRTRPRRPTAADSPLALLAAVASERASSKEQAWNVLSNLVQQAPDADPAVYVRQLRLGVAVQTAARNCQALAAAIAAHPAEPGILEAGEQILASILPEQAAVEARNLAKAETGVAGFAIDYVAGRLFERGKARQEALDRLAQAARARPQFVPAYVGQMAVELAAGNSEKVVAIREQAVAAGVKAAAVHHLAGKAHLAARKIREGLDELRQAEQLDRDNVPVLLDLAEAYLADDQPAAAMRRLRRAFDIEPKNVQVLVRLARANEAMNQWEEASSYAAKALEIDPKSADGGRIRGLAVLQEGKARQGLDLLTKTAKDHPEDVRCQISLGQALLAAGRPADAVAPLQKALALDEQSLAARRALAEAFGKTQQLDEAIEQYRILSERQPADEQIAGSLTGLLIAKGRLQDAAAMLDRLKATRQPLAEEIVRQAIASGQFELAMKVIASQAETAPAGRDGQRRRWQAMRIELLSRTGKHDEAIKLADALHKGDPDDSELAKVYLRALLAGRKDESALALAGDQVERQKDIPDQLRLWRAVQVELLGKLKRHDEAVKIAEAAHAANKDDNESAMLLLRALLAARRYEPALALTAEQADRMKETKEELLQWQIRRVTVMELAGRRDEAIAAAKTLYEEAPAEVPRAEIYVESLLSGRKFDQVLAVLDQLDKASVRLPRRQAIRMSALARLGRVDEAGKVLDDWLKAADERARPDIWYMASNVYALAGRRDQARAALAEVLKLDPRHASANNDLGYQLADQGVELDRAERMIRVALAQQPDQPAYLDSLAWVLYKKARFEDARKLFEQVLALEPEPDPVITDHYGDVLYRLGERAKALEQWKVSAEARDRPEQEGPGVPELDASTRDKTLQKIKAVEDNRPDVPVAPLGEGVTPAGSLRV